MSNFKIKNNLHCDILLNCLLKVQMISTLLYPGLAWMHPYLRVCLHQGRHILWTWSGARCGALWRSPQGQGEPTILGFPCPDYHTYWRFAPSQKRSEGCSWKKWTFESWVQMQQRIKAYPQELWNEKLEILHFFHQNIHHHIKWCNNHQTFILVLNLSF